MYYDNQTDPTSREGSEAGWLTKFMAVGMKWPLSDQTELIAQYQGGYTLLEIPGRFTLDVDFDSAFLLMTRKQGRFRFTGRFDWFDIDDVDGVSLDFSEHGWAATLAGRRGSTPILRTLQRSPIMGKRSVYVKAKNIQSRVQAGRS